MLLKNQLIDGNATVYIWKTKDGSTLVGNTDYSIANGKTMFLKTQTDSVYCEMTNANFPLFAGADVLKTTYTKVSTVTGIEPNKQELTQVYFSNKSLFVNAPYQAQLAVYDVNGRLAASKSIEAGVNTIPLRTTGLFLVKITNDKGSITRKMMVE